MKTRIREAAAATSAAMPKGQLHSQNNNNNNNDKPSRTGHLLRGIVIDLRGNLGGTLPSALDAASLFLPAG